jgi:hypothetical protein
MTHQNRRCTHGFWAREGWRHPFLGLTTSQSSLGGQFGVLFHQRHRLRNHGVDHDRLPRQPGWKVHRPKHPRPGQAFARVTCSVQI